MAHQGGIRAHMTFLPHNISVWMQQLSLNPLTSLQRVYTCLTPLHTCLTPPLPAYQLHLHHLYLHIWLTPPFITYNTFIYTPTTSHITYTPHYLQTFPLSDLSVCLLKHCHFNSDIIGSQHQQPPQPITQWSAATMSLASRSVGQCLSLTRKHHTHIHTYTHTHTHSLTLSHTHIYKVYGKLVEWPFLFISNPQIKKTKLATQFCHFKVSLSYFSSINSRPAPTVPTAPVRGLRQYKSCPRGGRGCVWLAVLMRHNSD